MLEAGYRESENKIIIQKRISEYFNPAARTQRIFTDGESFIDMEFNEDDSFLRFVIYPSELISPDAKNELPYWD
jgi:hypothetical protein